MRTFRGGLFW